MRTAAVVPVVSLTTRLVFLLLCVVTTLALTPPRPSRQVIVSVSYPVPDIAGPLLQRLRLLEEEGVVALAVVTPSHKSLKALSKAVGEEFTELAMNPILCAEDFRDSSELMRRVCRLNASVDTVVVCCSEPKVSSMSIGKLFVRPSKGEAGAAQAVDFLLECKRRGMRKCILCAEEFNDRDFELAAVHREVEAMSVPMVCYSTSLARKCGGFGEISSLQSNDPQSARVPTSAVAELVITEMLNL